MNLEELKEWLERVEKSLSDFADPSDIDIDFGLNRVTASFENESYELTPMED